jgi:hypothetical protein
METETARSVWAVVHSNFFPREIDSLWSTRELAQKRADQLGDSWRPEEWQVDPPEGE